MLRVNEHQEPASERQIKTGHFEEVQLARYSSQPLPIVFIENICSTESPRPASGFRPTTGTRIGNRGQIAGREAKERPRGSAAWSPTTGGYFAAGLGPP